MKRVVAGRRRRCGRCRARALSRAQMRTRGLEVCKGVGLGLGLAVDRIELTGAVHEGGGEKWLALLL